MPTVRYTGGGRYRVGGHNFGPGDKREVDEDLADHLAGVDEFDILGDYDVLDDDGDDSDGDDGSDDDPDGEFDVDAFLDRTPVEDVADDIRAGEADGHLDAVEETADRVTVEDAIEDRRDDLEG